MTDARTPGQERVDEIRKLYAMGTYDWSEGHTIGLLLARVSELERAAAEARNEKDRWREGEREMEVAWEASQRLLAEAHAALKRYGVHDPECGWQYLDSECTCGLSVIDPRDTPPPPASRRDG